MRRIGKSVGRKIRFGSFFLTEISGGSLPLLREETLSWVGARLEFSSVDLCGVGLEFDFDWSSSLLLPSKCDD